MRKATETLLSQRLKELRADKGITQKQLASEIGVSYGSIVDYENGRREPNSKAMAVLERYFKVSGEYLRGEVDRAHIPSEQFHYSESPGRSGGPVPDFQAGL